MSGIRDSLTDCVDDILAIRQDIGAELATVDFVTRVWSGQRIGDGSFSDTLERMFPLPCIKDLSHDVRLTEGGSIKQGDLILTGVSRNQYPDEEKLRTDTGLRNVEKFYKIGPHYYRTMHIKERLVTWDVHVRKVLLDEQEG